MEQTIFNLIFGLSGQSGFLDGVGTFFAHFLVYIIGIIFLWLLLVRREPLFRLRNIFFSALSLIVSLGIIRTVLDYFFSRPRPFNSLPITPLITAVGNSFPSFSTALAFTLSMITVMALSRRAGFWLLIFSALLGASLIFTGVAWPLDVVAGTLIGIVSPVIVRLVLPKKTAIVASVESGL